MASHFFALFSRMKNINRWALMRNTKEEPLSQHCLEVAAIAHCLAEIGNRRLGKDYDAARVALLGMYHDMPEIITGDMPTPVKYYNSRIRESFGEIEKAAQDTILSTLPPDLREAYSPLIKPDETTQAYRLVKAADRIAALIKCTEEENMGNREFATAKISTSNSLHAMHCEEAEIFISEFMDSFSLVLDNMLKGQKSE